MKDLDGLELATFIAASSSRTRLLSGCFIRPLNSERANECKRLGVTTILKPMRRAWFARSVANREDATDPCVEWRPADYSYRQDRLFRRLRILLAEDNLVNQRLISRILEKMGHTVVVAGDGASALTRVVATGIRSGRHGYANAA